MKKIGLLVMVLVIALGVMGLGYALWDKQLYINGTVNTGEVNAVFVDVFTDDDGTVDDALKDDGDDGGGTAYDRNGAASSDDPNMAGPNPTRENKDVGMCTVTGEGLQTLTFTVSNGYPCYYNTAWFHIKNTGTVPVIVNGLHITPTGFTNGVEVMVAWDGDAYDGMQIDPYETVADLVQCSLNIHVLQDALENQTDVYMFEAVVDLVQWNEYGTVAPWPR